MTDEQAFKVYSSTDCGLTAAQDSLMSQLQDAFFKNLNNLVNALLLDFKGMQSFSPPGAPISTWCNSHHRLATSSKKQRMSAQIQPTGDTRLQSHSTAEPCLLWVPSSENPGND